MLGILETEIRWQHDKNDAKNRKPRPCGVVKYAHPVRYIRQTDIFDCMTHITTRLGEIGKKQTRNISVNGIEK